MIGLDPDREPAKTGTRTGSVAATLAALLAEIRGHDAALTIQQGEDMSRPSLIEATAIPGGRVTVSGQALRVMQGKLV